MAAPTFVSYQASSFLTSASPKTVNAAVQIGDVIVVAAACENATENINAPTDTVNTYTQRQMVDSGTGNESIVALWTAVATTATTLTVSCARANIVTVEFGIGVWVWRNATVGASASNGPNGGTAGAPSQNLTTTGIHSAICIVTDDWNAVDGATRTWRSVNGTAATEDSYARDTAHTVYVGHHLDTGGVGVKTVGVSAPAGQKYSIAAIEVLGGVIPDLTVARFVQ